MGTKRNKKVRRLHFPWCFFLMIGLGLWVLRKSEVLFSTHHIRSIWLITSDINLDHLVMMGPTRFVHCKVTVLSFHTLFFKIKEDTKSNPHPKERVSTWPTEGGISTYMIWNSSVRQTCLRRSIYLPIQSFIYIILDLCLFYTLDYNPILHYLFCAQIALASAMRAPSFSYSFQCPLDMPS